MVCMRDGACVRRNGEEYRTSACCWFRVKSMEIPDKKTGSYVLNQPYKSEIVDYLLCYLIKVS